MRQPLCNQRLFDASTPNPALGIAFGGLMGRLLGGKYLDPRAQIALRAPLVRGLNPQPLPGMSANDPKALGKGGKLYQNRPVTLTGRGGLS